MCTSVFEIKYFVQNNDRISFVRFQVLKAVTENLLSSRK